MAMLLLQAQRLSEAIHLSLLGHLTTRGKDTPEHLPIVKTALSPTTRHLAITIVIAQRSITTPQPPPTNHLIQASIHRHPPHQAQNQMSPPIPIYLPHPLYLTSLNGVRPLKASARARAHISLHIPCDPAQQDHHC